VSSVRFICLCVWCVVPSAVFRNRRNYPGKGRAFNISPLDESVKLPVGKYPNLRVLPQEGLNGPLSKSLFVSDVVYGAECLGFHWLCLCLVSYLAGNNTGSEHDFAIRRNTYFDLARGNPREPRSPQSKGAKPPQTKSPPTQAKAGDNKGEREQPLLSLGEREQTPREGNRGTAQVLGNEVAAIGVAILYPFKHSPPRVHPNTSHL
jgi:hypothetical protein